MIARCLLRQRTTKTLLFDYIIPDIFEIKPYTLVEVPFSNKKVEAIVTELKTDSPYANKSIARILSKGPILTKTQFEIGKQISYEFFSFLPSAIFSFFPVLNKKDLQEIGSALSPRLRKKIQKPLLVNGDLEQRENFYLQKIDKASQNLIILPKIADLERMERKIKRINPSLKVQLWHSQIPARKKALLWQKIISAEPILVLSTRHGLFLPFIDLSTLILDDPSNFAYFEDQSPRYNAEAAARIVGKAYHANLIFGDNLPTLQGYAWLKSGKAELVSLKNSLEINTIGSLESVYGDDSFIEKFNESRRILVTGYFKEITRIYCSKCDNPLKCARCEADKFLIKERVCLKCYYPQGITCPICKSAKLKTGRMNIENIEKKITSIFTNEASKITIASFGEISQLGKVFDLALVAFFDSFASFPFLNFKIKLIKNILDLQQAGVKSVYLSTLGGFPDLIEKLITRDFNKIFLDELKNRKSEKLPPFYRAIELIGAKEEMMKLNEIIPYSSWIERRGGEFINFISHNKTKELQEFYSKHNLSGKLRLDPPEFS